MPCNNSMNHLDHDCFPFSLSGFLCDLCVFAVNPRPPRLRVEILYGAVWAPKWFEIKVRLEKETKAHIPYEEYREICGECHLSDESTRETLIRFLNDLGSIIHFDDPNLENTRLCPFR